MDLTRARIKRATKAPESLSPSPALALQHPLQTSRYTLDTKTELNPAEIKLSRRSQTDVCDELLADFDSRLTILHYRAEEACTGLTLLIAESERFIQKKQAALYTSKILVANHRDQVAALTAMAKSAEHQKEIITRLNTEMISVSSSYLGLENELEGAMDDVQKTDGRLLALMTQSQNL